MVIVNQDRDEIFNLSAENIFYRRHYAIANLRPMLMGFNLYGRTKNGRALLGTFDSALSCKITKAEIKQHEKGGMFTYTVPEEVDDLEDVELAEFN